jgi:oligopeptide/dipeptide ABC transporter ATP-binding protein
VGATEPQTVEAWYMRNHEGIATFILFISHDLAVVEFLAILWRSCIKAELLRKATTKQLCSNPFYPYTRLSTSKSKSTRNQDAALNFRIPNKYYVSGGCPFYSQCSLSKDYCLKNTPELKLKNGGNRHIIARWKT